MRKLDITLAAGVTAQYGFESLFVRARTSTGELRVRAPGVDVPLSAGQSVRLPRPVSGWEISNEGGGAVNAELVFADAGEDYDDSSLSGTVTATITQGATLAASTVSVGTSATQLVAASAGRKSVRFENSGTVNVYLGPAGVTTSNGLTLLPGEIWIETEGAAAAWYAISGSAAQTVRVQEVSA